MATRKLTAIEVFAQRLNHKADVYTDGKRVYPGDGEWVVDRKGRLCLATPVKLGDLHDGHGRPLEPVDAGEPVYDYEDVREVLASEAQADRKAAGLRAAALQTAAIVESVLVRGECQCADCVANREAGV